MIIVILILMITITITILLVIRMLLLLITTTLTLTYTLLFALFHITHEAITLSLYLAPYIKPLHSSCYANITFAMLCNTS